MYDTMVNLQSGPRVLGETFELHALPGTKNTPLDDLRVFAQRLRRRSQQLRQAGLLEGQVLRVFGDVPPRPPVLRLRSAGQSEHPQRIVDSHRALHGADRLLRVAAGDAIAVHVQHRAPHDRHQPDPAAALDVDLPLRVFEEHLPGAEPDARAATRWPDRKFCSRNTSATAPTISRAAIDWKPVQGTKLTFEEQIDHYKGDSYFTMAPQYLNVQEADGTKVSLLDSYQSFLPYGYSSTTGAFAASSKLQRHQHDQFVHDSFCQSQWRPADHQSGVQRHHQLLPRRSRRATSFPPRSSGCKARASRISR